MATVILPPVQHVIRCAFLGTWDGQPYTNLFHVQYTGADIDQAGLDTFTAAVHAAYASGLLVSMCNTVTLSTTQTQDLTNRQAPVSSHTSPLTGGDVTIGVSSVQTALCISWTIADRYRGGHPRMYLPGLVQGDMSSGHLITDAAVTKWSNAGKAFLTAVRGINVGGSPCIPVAVRYFSQHQLLPTPLIRPISTCVCHKRVDSQRRRLGKEVA